MDRANHGVLKGVEAPEMNLFGKPWSRRKYTFLGGLIFPAGLCILDVICQSEEFKEELTEGWFPEKNV